MSSMMRRLLSHPGGIVKIVRSWRLVLLPAAAMLAVAAVPALAGTQWNTEMKAGGTTASRQASGSCDVTGSAGDPLAVSCAASGNATMTYAFSSTRAISGKPTFTIDASKSGSAHLKGAVKLASKHKIVVTVVVAGAGSVQLRSVSVGYYTS
jgi:hypothetical protein